MSWGEVKMCVCVSPGMKRGCGISLIPWAPGEQAGLLLRLSRAQVLSTGINLSCLSTLQLPTPDPTPPFNGLGYKASWMETGCHRGPAERQWRR